MGKIHNFTLDDFGFDSAIYLKKLPTLRVGGISYSRESKIVTDDDIYEIDLLPSNINDVKDNFYKEGVAYLSGDMYYPYRGLGLLANAEEYRPGIYKERDSTENQFFIV